MTCLAVACAADSEPRTEAPHEAAAEAQAVEIHIGTDVTPEQVESLARFVESSSHAERVRVSVRKGEGDTHLTVQTFGGRVDPDIGDALRKQYPTILAGAHIETENLGDLSEADVSDVEPFEVDPDLSPQEAEAEVRRQMAERGVQGDVEVRDDGKGRREVEIRVKKKGDPSH